MKQFRVAGKPRSPHDRSQLHGTELLQPRSETAALHNIALCDVIIQTPQHRLLRFPLLRHQVVVLVQVPQRGNYLLGEEQWVAEGEVEGKRGSP